MIKLKKSFIISILLFSASFANENLINLSNNLTKLNNLAPENDNDFSEKIYIDLEQAIREVLNGQTEALDLFKPNDIAQIAKDLLKKIQPHLQGHDLIKAITFLTKIYFDIVKYYPPQNELRFVSFITGNGILDTILLRLLIEKGYQIINFYLIDQTLSTKKRLKKLKEQFEFSDNLKLIRFENATSYIEKVLKNEREIPHVFFTSYPKGGRTKGSLNFISAWPTKQEPESEKVYIIEPYYIQEIGILSPQFLKLKNFLSKPGDVLTKSEIIQNFLKINKLQYRKTGSVTVDFLEIIKLANNQNPKLLAYFFDGIKSLKYNNINRKTLTELYKETKSANNYLQNYYIWLWNPVAKEFYKALAT